MSESLQEIDFSAGPTGVDLEVRWIHGRPRGARHTDPPLQAHWVDAHTVMLRQSKQLTFEAPFLYLLFGNHRALLLDTGAVAESSTMPLASTIDHLIDQWWTARTSEGGGRQGIDRGDYRLVVAHTHGHSDHVKGDGQFVARPGTDLLGVDVDDVVSYFGFDDWPLDIVPFDLGGRVLEVMGCPGHQPASIAVYDPWTELLLTGDSVYPGRLYVLDMASFLASLDRLVTFCEQRPVSRILGCHIEMAGDPGVDYPIGTRYQPDEPPLEMSVAQLRNVRAAAYAVQSRPGVHVFDDFIIFNGRCVTGVLRQLGRAWSGRLRERFRRW